MSSRLAPLDGLRGIAIIAVILNHIPLGIWSSSLPIYLRPILDIFLAGGKTGVCILFLLTGFLMSWLYPHPTSAVTFWSRRYARLFPSFLVMVISLSIIKNNNLPIWTQLLLVLGIASFARILWEIFLKVNTKFSVGRMLTAGFISLQISVALWYSFYLLKIPSPIFYQTWDKNLQIFITGLINGTLTLPFGNYVGQIDGVYWSLVTEVSFYLFYPILFVPVFTYINHQKSLLWKTILAISTLPFCWSLYLISQRTSGFSLMIPHLYIYFIAGVAIGSNLSWFQKQILRYSFMFSRPWLLFITFFVLFSGPLFYSFIHKLYQPWVGLILVFPMSLLVVVLTVEESSWGKFFDQKWLTVLGKYSYSLYLTHSLCIEISQKIISPNSVVNGVSLTVLVFAASLCLSWCLFQIIEKPYYSLPKLINANVALQKPSSKIIIIFSVISLIVTYLSFRPPVSLFTYVSAKTPDKPVYLFPNQPHQVMFTGQYNNLGMITSHVLNIKSGQAVSSLSMRLLDSQNNQISQSNFSPGEIIENRFHPFGFPVQFDSLDKKYTLKYLLVSDDPQSQVEIITSESTLNSVYFADKIGLIKNSSEFTIWFSSKISEPFQNSMFWICLTSLLPLVLLINYPFLAKVRVHH